ncbi:hypothetical protein Q7O44_08745, partial [Shigella flexneri]|nr:hypothetical protein [Shigella flexneri]
EPVVHPRRTKARSILKKFYGKRARSSVRAFRQKPLLLEACNRAGQPLLEHHRFADISIADTVRQ